MIPREDRLHLPDEQVSTLTEGIYIMAVNRTAGVTKVKVGSSAKKARVIKRTSREEDSSAKAPLSRRQP